MIKGEKRKKTDRGRNRDLKRENRQTEEETAFEREKNRQTDGKIAFEREKDGQRKQERQIDRYLHHTIYIHR